MRRIGNITQTYYEGSSGQYDIYQAVTLLLEDFKNEYTWNISKVSYVGPLSYHKGCDLTRNVSTKQFADHDDLSYELMSDNPSGFTDSYCFLPWIGEQYGLKPPVDYVYNRTRCEGPGLGDMDDANKTS